MKLFAETALADDTGVARIIAALPSAASCGLARWPDKATLTNVAKIGVLFSLQSEDGEIDPGLYMAAVSSFSDFHDEPVIDALFSWVAWMYLIGGTAKDQQAFDEFLDGCLIHANDLSKFGPSTPVHPPPKLSDSAGSAMRRPSAKKSRRKTGPSGPQPPGTVQESVAVGHQMAPMSLAGTAIGPLQSLGRPRRIGRRRLLIILGSVLAALIALGVLGVAEKANSPTIRSVRDLTLIPTKTDSNGKPVRDGPGVFEPAGTNFTPECRLVAKNNGYMVTYGSKILAVLLDSDVRASQASRLVNCRSWHGTKDLDSDYKFYVPVP